MEKTRREIKFRGWNHRTKEMYYQISIGGKPIDDLDEFFKKTAEDGFVWMQYTGLKDKNGKEIYESDILLFDLDDFEVKGVVEYIGNGFWIRNKRDGSFMPDVKYREVVGNIYENPNLLSDTNER